jgi:hypothetical protein
VFSGKKWDGQIYPSLKQRDLVERLTGAVNLKFLIISQRVLFEISNSPHWSGPQRLQMRQYHQPSGKADKMRVRGSR